MPPRSVRVTVFALCLAVSGLSHAADPKPVNLLRLAAAVVDPTGSSAGAIDGAKSLFDDDARTIADFPATDNSPATILIGFGGEPVALERLVVTMSETAADADPAARVDLLVSTLSPHAGFQSVRADALKPGPKPQEFPFAPIAARWVMLRFYPAHEATSVKIAEVAVLGHQGPPVTRYRFKESPAKAFDVLRRLERSSTLNVRISDDEAKLFEDARDGKFDEWSFAEAALLSSGMLDRAKRRMYLSRLESIEAEVKSAIAGEKTPFDKGQKLLKLLHAGPMSKGYKSSQTDMSAILDTGTFNCVSSATLYNILGRRLGLDCRAIEVPEHAFAILYDGTTHADIETTTPEGFNPSRDRGAQEKFTQLTGFSYIPDSNRNERREVGEVGLVALTYYNHGVELTREKRHHEALLAYFRAMSLDSEFDSAVKNALAALANWGVELSRDKRFDEALNVVATGLELAPEDATLVNNHTAIWGEWAETLIKEGQRDEALAVLRKAAKAIPTGHFVKMQAWVFIRPGEELVKSGHWEQALALVDPNLQKLDGEPRRELQDWGANLFLRWAQSELTAKRFDKALDVLDRALALQPENNAVVRQLAYVVQESATAAYSRDGAAKSQEFAAELVGRYSKFKEVREVAQGHAQRVVLDLTKREKFDEALEAAARSGKLLDDEKLAADLSHAVFDRQAADYSKQKDWKKSTEVYVNALKRFPKDKHLENNLSAAWDSWARDLAKAKDFKAALDVYEQALPIHPEPQHVEQNVRYFVQEWALEAQKKEGVDGAEKVLKTQIERFRDIKDMGRIATGHFQRVVQEYSGKDKFEEALAVVERSRDILKDDKEVAQLAGRVYDAWAGGLVKKRDWQGAIDAYAQGLKKFPKDPHLENNAVVTWQQWAKTFMDKKDWPGAIGVYEKAAKQFPENGTITNNLKYCQQQAEKPK
jgi:tetratricopeptide (TPR) repeat protein